MNSGAAFITDDILYRVMAKLVLLKRGATGCSGTFNVVIQPGNTQGSVNDFLNNSKFPDLATFSNLMLTTFGAACEVSSKAGNSFDVQAPTSASPFATVKAQVSAACLRVQIEFVLSQVQQGSLQPGTDGLPCSLLTGKVKGDWDQRMKTLVRILFLDKLKSGDNGGGPVLSATVAAHIQNDLLSLDTFVGPDSYSLFGCGDTERNTDSSQDREDSASSEGDFLDSVGDAGDWFLHFLIDLGLFLTPAGAAAALSSVLPPGASDAVIVAISTLGYPHLPVDSDPGDRKPSVDDRDDPVPEEPACHRRPA